MMVAGAACSGCGLDRSDDPSLSSPERLPCPTCRSTAVTYSRTLFETLTTTATVSSTFRPGARERDWRVRWSQLQQRLAGVTAPRPGVRSADTLHDAEQDLFEFSFRPITSKTPSSQTGPRRRTSSRGQSPPTRR